MSGGVRIKESKKKKTVKTGLQKSQGRRYVSKSKYSIGESGSRAAALQNDRDAKNAKPCLRQAGPRYAGAEVSATPLSTG